MLALLAFAPGPAERGHRGLRALGRALGERPLVIAALALAAAVLVLQFPDRLGFVGDFLLRQGLPETVVRPERISPQAAPLDVWIHDSLPRSLARELGVAPHTITRAVGAIDAAILAVLAVVFARQLGAKGAALAAVAAALWWGGWLGLFTGYGKAFAQLTWLILAAAVTGLAALRGRLPVLFLGLVVALSLWFHRSAIALLPALALAAAWVPGSRRRASFWLGLALPAASLGILVPAMWRSLRALDVEHVAPGGAPWAALEPLRLLDAANVIFLLAPLAPLALWAGRAPADRSAVSTRERIFLWVLAAPWLLTFLFLHPAQGVFRDWDVFAPAAMALSLLAALALAEVLRAKDAPRRLAAPAMASCAVPVLVWLALQSDFERGMKRVAGWVEGPPVRDEVVRHNTWYFLGLRALQLERFEEAAAPLERAAELAPHPRAVFSWALAAERAGDWAGAARAHRRLLERADSEHRLFRYRALTGLARVEAAAGNRLAAVEAARRAQAEFPNAPLVREVLRELNLSGPGADADSLRRP